MKNIITFTIPIAIVLSVISCTNDISEDSLKNNESKNILKVVPSSESGISFKNKVMEDVYRNSMFFDYFLNGAGVAVGDINNDGLPDIFFTGNDAFNELYLNKGNLKFEKILADYFNEDTWSTGANMVDINNDGYLDIYVCNGGLNTDDNMHRNKLYINQGNLTFKEEAEKYGLDDSGLSIHSSFFDYDQDGDLDLWLNNHVNFNGDIVALLKKQNSSDAERKKYRSRLYQNNNGKFVDVTEKAGVSRESASLGVITKDLNDDGFIDVYVSNDYDIPDYYFINNGDGTFSEQSKKYMGHTSFYSMGIDAEDINNDSEIDFVAVDMTPSDHVRNKTLMASMDVEKFNYLYNLQGLTPSYMYNTVQIGKGRGYFSEVGNFLGVSQTEWSWAPLLMDIDNDGLKDLYITNGYYRDTKDNDFKRRVEEYKIEHGVKWNKDVFDYLISIVASTPVKNKIFKNNISHFYDITASTSDLQGTFSNGAAYADFDNDGDLDLIINNVEQEATLLENTFGGNYLKVKLTNNNLPVYNSIIKITTKDGEQRSDYVFSKGYQSSVEQVVHFGLGDNQSIDKLTVIWPDNTYSEMKSVSANQLLTIDKTKIETKTYQRSNEVALFSESDLTKDISHKEMWFNDFDKEILLPHKYSDLGPALAVNDINNDGIDDIFLGGSNTSESQLLLSRKDGYSLTNNSALIQDKKYEDLGAHFFDANGDGIKDLYIASGGGGEIEEYQELTQDRLYLIDKDGNFTNARQNLPPIASSTKAIVSADFDQDGDFDLIIGGRNKPGAYPSSSKTYYLENNGGVFRDRSKKMFPDIDGMISDIEAIDFNNDEYLDVIVTSEWSAPFVLIYENGVFNYQDIEQLKDHSGWWQSVKVADLDNDGDQDIILGNMGLNNKFHPSQDKPLGVLASDFDETGTLDIVLTKKYNGNTVPVRGKECSSAQMPMISEKFPTYEGFATSTIEEILGEDKIKNADSKKVVDFSSYYMINENGEYRLERLPYQAQQFPIMDAEVLDVNQDGRNDIILVGNKLGSEPETPSYDAGTGLVLINGENGFTVEQNINKTGILAKFDARNIKKINLGNGQEGIVIANNNGPLQTYLLNK